MNERLEILFRSFEESMAHVRHLEEQRSQFASVLIAVVGGVITFGPGNVGEHFHHNPGFLVSGIGAFGVVLSWKQNEKISYHRQIAIRHRQLIEKDPSVIDDRLDLMRKEEVSENDRRYLRISILPVGLFWSMLYVLILGFGAAMVFTS